MIKQPAFICQNFRVSDHLKNTDFIMNKTFFLGTYPGNTTEKLDYIEKIVDEFMVKFTNDTK